MDSTKLNILTSSLRKGEKSAYQEIYNEFFGVLYHLSLQYLHDKEAAHEIVQDTFLKLWEIRETLNEHFNIRNFLYTIAKNSCLNYLRNLKIAHSHQQNIKYLETQYNYMALEELDNWFEFDELSERIDHAILLLPEDLRETFLLSRYDELHYKEIAEKQSVSVKTVEVRISKALRILRHELKEYLAIGWLIISGLS
jgi:RNA polymerase sigma-70 factor (ECF subfamily)